MLIVGDGIKEFIQNKIFWQLRISNYKSNYVFSGFDGLYVCMLALSYNCFPWLDGLFVCMLALSYNCFPWLDRLFVC